MNEPLPESARIVICEWQLVSFHHPQRGDLSTKTYVHKHPDRDLWSVIRLVKGRFARHITLSTAEVEALSQL